MLIVISPAKTLDYETPVQTKKSSQAQLLADSQALIDQLRTMAPQQLSSLMHISDKLGLVNYDRYQQWQQPFTLTNAKQAILAFKGDVYTGLNAGALTSAQLDFAQQHLRILSGLYGVLRPLDLMQAYRLEMGTKLVNDRGKDLYAYWGDKITENINQQLKNLKTSTLVNLASTEYFKAVQPSKLDATVITPIFKDKKNGHYKIISFYAKKARGLMTAYAIKQGITNVDRLKQFDLEGYRFNQSQSTAADWVFTRESVD